MKEKSSNLLEQIYVTPRIEVIALQDEQPLMAGSKKIQTSIQALNQVMKMKRNLILKIRGWNYS